MRTGDGSMVWTCTCACARLHGRSGLLVVGLAASLLTGCDHRPESGVAFVAVSFGEGRGGAGELSYPRSLDVIETDGSSFIWVADKPARGSSAWMRTRARRWCVPHAGVGRRQAHRDHGVAVA